MATKKTPPTLSHTPSALERLTVIVENCQMLADVVEELERLYVAGYPSMPGFDRAGEAERLLRSIRQPDIQPSFTRQELVMAAALAILAVRAYDRGQWLQL